MMHEYQKHILDTHANNAGKSLCGEAGADKLWSFVDVDHAFQNARSGGRLVPCPKCLGAVLRAFDSQK